MTDSLIFIAQRKTRDILQIRKYSAHCNHSRPVKDGRQNATIVISLEKFDMISYSSFLRTQVFSEYHSTGITCRYINEIFFMSTSA